MILQEVSRCNPIFRIRCRGRDWYGTLGFILIKLNIALQSNPWIRFREGNIRPSRLKEVDSLIHFNNVLRRKQIVDIFVVREVLRFLELGEIRYDNRAMAKFDGFVRSCSYRVEVRGCGCKKTLSFNVWLEMKHRSLNKSSIEWLSVNVCWKWRWEVKVTAICIGIDGKN
jgi:hypothetical protein